MSQPKAAVTTFDSGWQKIKSWANSQKIPQTAVNNVYALDQGRIQRGSFAMSNAERTRAILAAAGMNYNTALPSDAPSASNVLGNTVTNAKSIATGLQPTRLAANIFDTLKNSVLSLANPSRNKGANPMETAANEINNTVLSWIPGIADLGTFLKAQGASGGNKMAGIDALAAQPISTVLDVFPVGKLLDRGVGGAVAKTAAGDALSTRLGMAPKAMGKMGALRIGGKAVGSIRLGSEVAALRDQMGRPVLDAAGLPTYGRKTLSQRASDRATAIGTGKLLSTTAHTVTSILNQKTIELQNLTRDLTRDTSVLTPDTKGPDGAVVQGTHSQFNQLLHSGREASDLLGDPTIPVPIKKAIQSYQKWEDWHREYVLAAGHVVPFHHPDGTVSLYESSSKVFPAQERANAAVTRAEKVGAKAEEIVNKSLALDQLMAPKLERVSKIKDSISGAVNTTQKVHKTQINLLGKLAGRDGYLDQMTRATAAKDWTALRDAAKRADSLLKNKTTQDWMRVPMLAELQGLIRNTLDYSRVRLKLESAHERAFYGTSTASKRISAATLEKRAEKVQAEFLAYVRAHPSSEWHDVVLRVFNEKFLANDASEVLMDTQAAGLKSALGPEAQAVIDRLRADPQKLREVVVAYSDPTFSDPFIPDMTPKDHAMFMNSALSEVDSLRARGFEPMYVPTVAAKDVHGGLTSPQVKFSPMKAPTTAAAFKKAMDMSSSVNDVMLGVTKATKDALERDGKLESFNLVLKPMLTTGTALRRAVIRDHLANITEDTSGTALASVDNLIRDHYGMTKFDVKAHTGLDPSEFGLDPKETHYLPEHFGDQMMKMFDPKSPNKLSGIWDKSTKVFKYSILGLSPRYTAHIALGGTVLLAGRVHPQALLYIGKAAREVGKFHRGEPTEIDPRVFQGAGQRGEPEIQVHYRGGASMGKLTVQEWLVNHGVNPKVAKVADFIRAQSDINFRFTNYVSDIQRSVAYLDGARHADKVGHYVDPQTGETMKMTSDRAHFEGMRAAERVMGNLQAMTPLERSVARKIMPFYGWTKHIIKYVLTYPVDHPWRAMFLSTLATQNSDNFASGLDQRMQLLFFLGSPDPNGNVSAIDARVLNPFRDVANYATFAGWFSSLNPVITAPLTMVDPQLIYGGNVLHPTITYDSFYGTNTAAPGGSLVTAAEQEVPQISILDNALGLTAQARSLKASGGNAATKAIYQAFDIPFAQVQHLNLQQISAKHEIDRYNQAKAEAANAWQTGDFSALMQYPGTVPDPLQTGYNISPAQLAKQYEDALKRVPNLPPSETVAPLPAPLL